MKSRKPLVKWCRWNSAVLRLAGHDEQSVWGEFFYHREDRTEAFRFDMHHWVLTRTTTDGDVVEHLDEMGLLREQS